MSVGMSDASQPLKMKKEKYNFMGQLDDRDAIYFFIAHDFPEKKIFKIIISTPYNGLGGERKR